MTPEERFWAKVEKTATCWLWKGARTSHGYGTFVVDGRRRSKKYGMAHRVAYELVVGPIPAGLTIDHLCRVPACVNPKHLEPVSMSVNVLRGDAPTKNAALNLAKTHCPQGHPYSGANLYVYPDGRRGCRKCRNASRRLSQLTDEGGSMNIDRLPGGGAVTVRQVSLWVYTASDSYDDEIIATVGRESDGSGYDFDTVERDLSFPFSVDEPAALGEALVRLARLPFVLRAEVTAREET